MVPAKLSLTNFLSYRRPAEIDLAGLHVACLSGDNGHGKSALLDAMTWALWGKARVNSDDDLIHAGETEMNVEFEFERGSQRYRVLRKRRRGGARSSGSTALELQMQGPDGWRQLTGNTVRATQQRIIKLLGLDYETFINSAFLMQGRADEFTTRAPAERKKVLGEILGLRRYDGLADRAKDEARARQLAGAELEAKIELIDRQTDDIQSLRLQRDGIRVELEAADEDLARRSMALDGLREMKRLADLRAEQLRKALGRLHEADDELSRLDTAIAQHERAIAEREAVIARAAEIERGYARLEAARSDEADYGRRAGKALALQGRQASLERLIERARQSVAEAERRAEDEVRELDQRAGRIPALTEEREKAERLRQEAESLGDQLRARRLEAHRTRDEAQALVATNDALHRAMKDLRSKLDELAAADAACPLCARPLGVEEKERIETAYRQQGSADASSYRDNKSKIESLQAQAAALHIEAEDLDRQRSERQLHAAARLAEIDRDLIEAHEAARDLGGARVRLASATDALAGGRYAPVEQAELRDVTAAIAALGYDAARHEELRRCVDDCARFDAEHWALSEAQSLLRNETKARESSLLDLADWRRRRDLAAAEVDELRDAAAASDDLPERLSAAEAERSEAAGLATRLRDALIATESGIEYREGLLAERGPKLARRAAVADERRVYDELARSFGRQGVQALLIDAALPELTEEANRLLQRMTAGRMSLMMSTQRAKKSGELAETLDIRIADELGTRPYETYSGGEAFRIDFALRIALSKLLARRAGAPLPTLIVDEGFGTQDASGRERLVEAITAVQDDFRMVLVVTHIDELRDVFPHRIHVTKTAQGSQVEVL